MRRLVFATEHVVGIDARRTARRRVERYRGEGLWPGAVTGGQRVVRPVSFSHQPDRRPSTESIAVKVGGWWWPRVSRLSHCRRCLRPSVDMLVELATVAISVDETGWRRSSSPDDDLSQRHHTGERRVADTGAGPDPAAERAGAGLPAKPVHHARGYGGEIAGAMRPRCRRLPNGAPERSSKCGENTRRYEIVEIHRDHVRRAQVDGLNRAGNCRRHCTPSGLPGSLSGTVDAARAIRCKRAFERGSGRARHGHPGPDERSRNRSPAALTSEPTVSFRKTRT